MFKSEIITKNSDIYNYIYGKSYVPNKDIDIENLRYLTVSYIDFSNKNKTGHLIVNEAIVEDILYIFEELFKNKYQLNSVELIEKYWEKDATTSDKNSMLRNNSSCFNYRNLVGANRLSWHAFGLAVDINPLNNPFIINKNGKLDYDSLTPEELYYAKNRGKNIAHIIDHDDLAYKLFTERGFEWGGDWDIKTRHLDYQHFEKHIVNNKKVGF